MPIEVQFLDRVVPDDGAALRAALTQLLLGVTPAEWNAGFRSAFSSQTAGQLRSVAIRDGVAVLDLTAGFVATNNFSTSNLGGVVMSQIEATVFQFPEVMGIEFRVEGERWCGWETTCQGAPSPLRDRETMGDGSSETQADSR